MINKIQKAGFAYKNQQKAKISSHLEIINITMTLLKQRHRILSGDVFITDKDAKDCFIRT